MLDFTNKKILLVVAHPDDEVLGIGATMNKLINESKASVQVIILGEGITARSDSRDTKKWESELKTHRANIEQAQRAIGFQSVNTYQFPDNRFDSVALLDIIKVVEHEKEKFAPDIIFTHHGGDLNIDHQRTFQAVITACRPMENEKARTIITFETPSGTEWQPSTADNQFIPNLFVEVSEKQVQAKIDAMESYEFEKRNYPHPRSPEALKLRAQYWGMTVGKKFVEPFMLVRHIGS